MNNKKITFIHPSISQFGFNSYRRHAMEASWISHGLCSLGAVMRERGYEVDLIDLRALSGWDAFDEEIKKRGARIFGINMMTVDFDPAVQAAQRIKVLAPEAIVITGGPHPTLMLPEVEEQPCFDYIVIREGEVTLPKLVESLESGKTVNRVLEGEPPELDDLPSAARDLYPELELPLPVPGFKSPFVTVIAGRGCMYNCAFCMPAEKLIFGRKVRKRSPGSIIKELEMLRDQYNFRSLFIHDDCITENRDWVEEFCALYVKKGFTAPFACQSRADLICKNQDTVRRMKDAGLSLFFIGFESGSDRILKLMNKGVTVAQNLEAASICKKLGIRIWANYMVGLPTETSEEMMATANMIRRIQPDWYSPAFFTPHPGSKLYDFCMEQNLLLIEDHKFFARSPNSDKIKGVDYEAARAAITLSQRLPRHKWLWKKYQGHRLRIAEKKGKIN